MSSGFISNRLVNSRVIRGRFISGGLVNNRRYITRYYFDIGLIGSGFLSNRLINNRVVRSLELGVIFVRVYFNNSLIIK